MPSSGYTAVTFVANEQPTTAKWNLLGSNDSAFNLGTGLEDSTILARHIAANVIQSGKIDWTTAGNIWWQELARATAGSTVASIVATLSSSKKYLWVLCSLLPNAGVASAKLRFNGDSGTNYTYRVSDNGGADTTGSFDGIPVDTGSGNATQLNSEHMIIDINGQEKQAIGHCQDIGAAVGVANIVKRRESNGKWTGTARITTITLFSGATNLTAGTEIVVLGHD